MWRLESERGRWHTSRFQFQVDLKRPDLGWTNVCLDDVELADSPFRICLPGDGGPQTLVDQYVRQADLVATYAQSPDRTVRPQLVWRALEDDERVGVEIIVSVQTSMLDSVPEVRVEHQLQGELLVVNDGAAHVCADQADWAEPAMILQRPSDQKYSMLIALHPSDFLRLSVHRNANGWQAAFQLFPESLEKGVIRRARMRGIFLPRADDIGWARKCLDELANATPPLTT